MALSDRAFRLWVWGLSFCQQHLTDGEILRSDLVGRRGTRVADQLISAGLWEDIPAKHAYQVHDYLDWNDSRDVVQARLALAKDRKDHWLARHGKERVVGEGRNGVLTAGINGAAPADVVFEERVPEPRRNDVQTKPNQTEIFRARAISVPDVPDEQLEQVRVLMQETWPQLYAQIRNGASIKLNEARDFGVCLDLHLTYGARLPLMLEYFLMLRPAKDVLNQPGTPRQLAHMAPQLDAELRAHGR